MMDYSSTDEATTSEDDENSVERQQNLVARSLQFPRRRAKKRQAVLMPEVDLRLIHSERGKQLVIHQVTFSPLLAEMQMIYPTGDARNTSKDAK
uniref:Uncharacterized protein n=1 Tax=Ditylenchus dipsaci TaxID=166011 RepID=A0A915DLY2_9BILA